ncbi:hypothetical protein [Haliangium sp.]|uniref:hypothetical protein n=1 Tax=Haliangium sp. TaxID=2663208 RepID=UPI003D13E549
MKSSLTFGGALRVSYFIKSWDGQEQNRDRFGDLAFDTFRVNVDGGYGPLSISAEYRLYQGYHMLHHGYVGYAVDDDTKIDVGISQVPFGILGFASHNFFFGLGYYIGFEDDYDLGVRATTKVGDLDIRAAFYKNSEASYTGSSIASARYSYDVVPTSVAELGYAGLTEDRANSETNQVNVRVAYPVSFGDGNNAEIGVSGEIGGLYNGATEQTGYHWAAAAHAVINLGKANIQLQGIAYDYKPENPDGQRDDIVVMGAYDFPYMVAARGYQLSANAAYTFDVNKGPLSTVTVYNDYSIVIKPETGFSDTHQNVTGTLLASGPIYTYIDLVLGKHHPWIGPNYGSAMAEGNRNEDGSVDASWNTRFNVNVGYYF